MPPNRGVFINNRTKESGINKRTTFKIDLGLSDIKVKSMKINENGEYHIYVSCTATSTECYKCNKKNSKTHGTCKETKIEHLPILDNKVFIYVKWPRFVCTSCDNKPTTSFHPSWLNDTGELTQAYENFFSNF